MLARNFGRIRLALKLQCRFFRKTRTSADKSRVVYFEFQHVSNISIEFCLNQMTICA